MDAFRIQGGYRLNGEIDPDGSKNAALPLISLIPLLNNKVTVTNVPEIGDIKTLIAILAKLGAIVTQIKDGEYSIDPTTITKTDVDAFLGSKIRGSYYLLGSLLSRFRKSSIPVPGGCKIGDRPIDLHISSLKEFGTEFILEEERTSAKLNRISAKNIVIDLPFPSRGATINSILTASLLEGINVTIKNSDQSPETSSVIKVLFDSGLMIKRIKRDIHLTGVSQLNIEEFSIPSDKIEIGTFLSLGLLTGGEVKVNKINKEDIYQLINVFDQMNVRYQLGTEHILVFPNQLTNLKSTTIISGLYDPCIDADYEPILAPVLCLASGNSLIEDTMNKERHSVYINRLNQMGASILELSPTRAIIEGNPSLKFTSKLDLKAEDIRGGVSQLIAAISANGESLISNIINIERGYSNIDTKINKLGGKVTRINL